MKTLQDVAKQFRKSAAQAIYPGFSYTGYKTGTSKAFRTGNLLSKFVSSPNNAPNRVGRKTITGFEFVLEVGPQGAEYGKYVHFGTLKMKKRPFAELGAEQSIFKDTLDEFMMGEVDDVVEETNEVISDQFRKAGFEVIT